ncbi:hypothetical protein NHQ30_002978 [Ciborinia camelliae]|nr:hypothetical protein NHQ30_002978 [Ciborinia camelliae]
MICEDESHEETREGDGEAKESQEKDARVEGGEYEEREDEFKPMDLWVPNLPDLEHPDFKKFTHRTPNDGARNASNYEPKNEHCSMWESHPDPECYSSFGDGGTTATVNAFGQLMQFSTYLGPGRSGMFSADHLSVSEPCFVRDRASDLDTMSRARNRDEMTYGVYIRDLILEDELVRKYVHCRWPRYEYESEKVKIINQWMVHDGVVLQQWCFANLDTKNMSTEMKFSKDMYIRDLEYQDFAYRFNDYLWSGNDHFLGPRGYSWICLHQLPANNSSVANPIDASSIGVIVSVFVNGVAIRFNSPEDWLLITEANQTTEVIVAYKLIHSMPEVSKDWKRFLVEADKTNVNNLLSAEFDKTQYRPIHLFSFERSISNVSAGESQAWEGIKNNLDFVIQRHLEHILTVCAIPIATRQGKSDTPAVALTCGDISAHRICISASFFTFLFLLKVDSHLRLIKPPDTYVSSLRTRIKDVCEGHLIWLNGVDLSEDGLFELGYMANQQILTSVEKSRNILTDTAFQIIKAGEFVEHYIEDSGQDKQQPAYDVIKRVYDNWTKYLAKNNEWGKFVWPRSQRGGFDVFRLDDHVWATRALKLAEIIISSEQKRKDVEKQIETRTSRTTVRPRKSQESPKDLLAKTYSFANVQQEALQRFTTQNPNYQSRKKMLAVTRSVRESRFLFHARDTALFYNIDWIDWKGTQFYELWKNTIESQPHHVNNQEESEWDNALRYALAIVMGTRGHQINATPVFELVQSAVEVLLGGFSSSGFIPGQLHKGTKKQALFHGKKDADFYYHASFEIPYILFKYASEIYNLYETPQRFDAVTSVPRSPAQPATSVGIPPQTKNQRQESVLGATLIATLDKEQKQLMKQVDAAKNREIIIMQKTTPLNFAIDITNIVNYNDEWLYIYPSIFSRHADIEIEELRSLADSTRNDPDFAGDVIQKELYKWCTIESEKLNTLDESLRLGGYYCFLIDTQQKQLREQVTVDDGPCFLVQNDLLWMKLRQPRTPEKAKKRLIWMPLVDGVKVLMCYLATPDIHKQSISLFFDRHVKNESYFFEETSLVSNTWETEFHLSFYLLIDSDSNISRVLASSSTADEFPGSNQKTKIAHASMGFRFDGDLLDRYWTGYFLENVPGLHKVDRLGRYETPRPIFVKDDRAQQQRRVLELQFFDRIAKQMVECTNEILKSIKDGLGIKQGALSSSVLNSDDYFTSSALWNKYQHILQVVEEELESAIRVIEKWEKREDDRKAERPRWTRKDKTKYRGFINKWGGSTSRQIGDLRSAYRNIKFLRETLTSSQDQIRNDLSLKGSERIRFFTYVTVVFLPLGFATSIFSMSGAPDGVVLINMTACAIIALLITILVLLNVKQLASIVDDLFSMYHRCSRAKIEHSIVVSQQKLRWSALEEAEEIDTEKKQAKSSRGLRNKQRRKLLRIETWTLLFWVYYISIEFPARRVLQASNELKGRKITFLSLVHILLGVVFLPLFIVSCLFQLIIYNAADILTADRLHLLTYLPDAARPMKLLVDKLRARREIHGNEKELGEKDTPENNDSDIERTGVSHDSLQNINEI